MDGTAYPGSTTICFAFSDDQDDQDDADGADVVTVGAGADGQRRTFVLAVDGGDDVSIDVTGTDSTLADAGDSVTYEYDGTQAQWWIVASYGI